MKTGEPFDGYWYWPKLWRLPIFHTRWGIVSFERLFYSNSTSHRRSNPKLISADYVKLDVTPPSFGRRLWVYFRGGHSFAVGFYVNRRDL